jgi:hypothetical protein
MNVLTSPQRAEKLVPLAILALGVLLSRQASITGPTGSVYLRGRELPIVCPIRRVTGRKCPSCGLTKGTLYALRGDLRSSRRSHWGAPFAALALVLAGIRSILPRSTRQTSNF